MRKKKSLTKKEAIAKLEHYCAYQERCNYEVRNKLWTLGFWGDWADEIVMHLIDENFLHEERFARTFARGKFRFKKWGKIKIRQKLREKRVNKKLIDFAIDKELDDEDYWKVVEGLVAKKDKTLREDDLFVRKKKIFNYLFQKGFESGLIWKAINAYEFEEISEV